MALNTLQIINEIQKNLRFPQSSAITDAHAALILGFLNRVQRAILKDAAEWPALKVYGDFSTVAGTDIYTISIDPSGEVSHIVNMQIGTYDPMVKYDDEDFRLAVRQQGTTQERPLVYRNYSRAGGDIKVQVCPTPDDVYQVDVEAVKRPPRLTLATEFPLLDEDVMIEGGYNLAKLEQRSADQLEVEAFLNSLTSTVINQGSSNLQDVEPV